MNAAVNAEVLADSQIRRYYVTLPVEHAALSEILYRLRVAIYRISGRISYGDAPNNDRLPLCIEMYQNQKFTDSWKP